MAERVLGNVISSGIKVLVLAVIIGIGSTLFSEFTAGFGGATPSIDDAMAIVLAALSLLGLGIFGPGIANGIVSGGPQLGAGAAIGTGLAAGGAVAAGAAPRAPRFPAARRLPAALRPPPAAGRLGRRRNDRLQPGRGRSNRRIRRRFRPAQRRQHRRTGHCLAAEARRWPRRRQPQAELPIRRALRLRGDGRGFNRRHNRRRSRGRFPNCFHHRRAAGLGERMKRSQQMTHGVQAAAHAVRSGDSHGGGSTVNLSEGD
jgi:type IV secretion system protein TrbL